MSQSCKIVSAVTLIITRLLPCNVVATSPVSFMSGLGRNGVQVDRSLRLKTEAALQGGYFNTNQQGPSQAVIRQLWLDCCEAFCAAG